EKATGVNLVTERDSRRYEHALTTLGASIPDERNVPSLMDALIDAAVRKQTTRPTFLLGAPVELEPLAKRDPDEPRLVQRMQLLAGGMELIKAYTEENDPAEQERRFREQAALRGSPDIHPLDAEYIEALKVGLPPTAGWGMGVDRLVMLATDQPSIRDVLFFPLLRPKAP
ncbi:MAG: amino acid--tRNA ligase-related protein, partial [bacterium]|nr:amino acid--tRNA ligase-related protein [bacterium]